MPIQPDIFAEFERLLGAAGEQHLTLRALGGLAVRAHSGDFRKFFQREYHDLDFVAEKGERRRVEPFFVEMGYESNRQFNLLNGSKRQIYLDPTRDRHVDIFIGDFEMCHKLPLDGRLHLDPVTIPLAELLLSKAQIVELNRKDALDIASLLLYNETGRDDRSGINLAAISNLCGQDWGLYKTTTINLERVAEIASGTDVNLSGDERALILARLHEVRRAIDEAPKSLAWQMRDKVGTRVRWYEEVEEVAR